MQDFDNIKGLWQKTATDLPSSKEILFEVEKARKKMMRKNIFGIITLSATFVFITFMDYEFELWTTRAGIILTLISICLGIIFMTGMSKFLVQKADETLDNSSYLEQLKKLQSRQRMVQTTGMGIYFILLTSGLMLYMYEFARRDLTFGIITYSLTLAWITFNWFFIRKRTIAKQEKALNDQIARIEKLIEGIRSKKS